MFASDEASNFSSFNNVLRGIQDHGEAGSQESADRYTGCHGWIQGEPKSGVRNGKFIKVQLKSQKQGSGNKTERKP